MEPGRDIVAVGGRLVPAWVIDAYRSGIFPWYDAHGPVLWWAPDPRTILPLADLHVPRRLARTLRRGAFEVRRDEAFDEIVRACDRNRKDGSWIHAEMRRCYGELHRMGHAHSLGVWMDGALAGGVYGVAVGGAFAAESMFHVRRDASKLALVCLVRHLVERGFTLLDVQFSTPHLQQFGCVEIPRDEYLRRLRAARDLPAQF